MAAIDSLKEEYEEHCRLAVQETKRYGNMYIKDKMAVIDSLKEEYRYEEHCRLAVQETKR
jgi:hypothetical protein